MRRLWIGIGLLVGIVFLGFWTTLRMCTIHTEISNQLRFAGQAAQSDQWDRADLLARQAEELWQRHWKLSAALADHTILDEIDGQFAQAEVFRQSRDPVAYAALCSRLAKSIEALQEAHRLTWWNLL